VNKEEEKRVATEPIGELSEWEAERTLAALRKLKALGDYGEVRIVLHQGRLLEWDITLKERAAGGIER
jgi:hypothetical protein